MWVSSSRVARVMARKWNVTKLFIEKRMLNCRSVSSSLSAQSFLSSQVPRKGRLEDLPEGNFLEGEDPLQLGICDDCSPIESPPKARVWQESWGHIAQKKSLGGTEQCALD